MKHNNVFWGAILILLGVLFYLKAANFIVDVQGWFWPIALMMLGIWILIGFSFPRVKGSSETFKVDLGDAARMDLVVNHGAGVLTFSSGAEDGIALSGSQGLGLEIKSNRSGDSLGVDISAGPTFLPFLGPEGGSWDFKLSKAVPVAIKLSAGSAKMDLDMTDIRLTYLGVETGASSLKVKLPEAAGHTLVDFESGAASIELIIPEGVGGRIKLEQGASSIKIDEKRFPVLTSMANIYQSADFDTASNRVEIHLEGGANQVRVS